MNKNNYEKTFKNGDKVKIKLDNYKNKKTSPAFQQFLKENGDQIFTIRIEDKYKDSEIYGIEENHIWLFHAVDLEKIEGE